MNNRRYRSEIELIGSCLDIRLDYESPTTKEEVEAILDYFEHRFSLRIGEEISRGEITTNIKEGDLNERITRFRVKLGESLYIGLEKIHQEVPYVLPNLMDDLERYIGDHDLQDAETRLIHQTVRDLRRIIEQ